VGRGDRAQRRDDHAIPSLAEQAEHEGQRLVEAVTNARHPVCGRDVNRTPDGDGGAIGR
jgi:hypothetical protein